MPGGPYSDEQIDAYVWTAPPAAAAGRLWVTLADSTTDTATLFVQPLPGTTSMAATFALDAPPGPWPVVVTGLVDELAVTVVEAGAAPAYLTVVVGTEAVGLTPDAASFAVSFEISPTSMVSPPSSSSDDICFV